jgi:YesN/AraC family two-component response regulator
MKKILIIDDEPYILSMLKKMLERAGYSVTSAENGRVGLDQFEIIMPDLVITDIIMPEKEGLGIIREMKSIKPDLKIIAISGGGRVSASDYLNTAKLFGADRAFQKPFSKDDMVGAVKELIG